MNVSVIIPTRNESANIIPLMSGIKLAMQSLDYEVIVVDDSDDNTAEVARSVGARVIKGQGKGLGQAIIDGIKHSYGEVVLVMDADGSHETQAIPSLLKPIMERGADLVVGSRYCKGGDYSDWSLDRKVKSLVGVKLMQLVTGVKDSNSGFFAFRKSIVDSTKLNGKTWKIMLEVLFKGKWVSKVEVPITFGDRQFGKSKRSTKQVFKDAVNLIGLVFYKYKRFVKFALVGGIGNIWHYGLLWILTEYAGLWYGFSIIIAISVAMTSNYFFNHYWSFKDRRDSNSNLLTGWLKFCGQSAIGDFGIAFPLTLVLVSHFGIWYMLASAIASVVALSFKYAVASKFIWGTKKKVASDAEYEWVSYYKGLPWQKRWKRIIASIVKEFAEYPNGKAGKVLDCGAGSSPCGLMVNHDDYIALDPNKNKMSYMAKKNLKDCTFITGNLDGTSFSEYGSSECFDTILFVEVIEHLSGIEEARRNLLKMHSLLKPNGKLVVATPNFGGFRGRAMDNLYGIFQKGAYKDEHRLKFGLESLKSLCEEYGFKYVQSRIPSGADMVCLFKKQV